MELRDEGRLGHWSDAGHRTWHRPEAGGAGFTIAMTGRRAGTEVASAVADVRGYTPESMYVQADVTNGQDRKRLLEEVEVRFGRIDVLVNNAFAPNYAAFVVLRGLYGIGMGGYWGIGASLVMESSPKRWRGLFSCIMQGGYSLGYLLAAVAIRVIEPRFGCQSLFLGGLGIAAIIAVCTLMAPESPAWQKNRLASFREIVATLEKHKGTFAYLVLLMTVILRAV